MRASLNGKRLFIGPLELQLGYKLYMGSPKDLEDARWMQRMAKGRLDEEEIKRTARALGVPGKRAEKVLGLR